MKTRYAAVLLTVFTTYTLGAAFAGAADPTPAPSASGAAAEEKPTVTKSGLQYVDILVGKGATPKHGQRVAIAYTAAVGNKRIESATASAPFEFVLGSDQALKGLSEGISTMKVGGKRKMMIPPALAYGNEQVGDIAPGSILVFEVELLHVK